MPKHILAIPLPPDVSNRETSGDRGIPEMDFDFLNEVSGQDRSTLGSLQNRAQTQQDDLSTILQGVNSTVKDVKKQQRDSQLMFTSQADELAARSDQVRQQTIRAAADPFNEVKALFGETPSMAEWGMQQNALQNELATLRRRYTSSAAGFNFTLSEEAGKIQLAQQKLALTKENISTITASSQAVMTQIGAQSALFTQQLDTMGTRAELQAEFDDKQGTIPKDLVRRRIAVLDLASAELSSVRATKGKTQLEITAKLFDVLTKYPELIPERAVDQALLSKKSVYIPLLDMSITPQMAGVIRPKQEEAAQLGAKMLAEATENTLRGQQAFTQVAGIFKRSAGPGVSVLARDEQGNVSGFNPDALPADMRQDAAAMFDLQRRAQTLQYTLADPNFTGVLREQTQMHMNEINRQAHELRNEIVKKAKEDAQIGVVGKQAKESASRWAELNIIKSDAGAQQLLAEGAIAVIPGTESILSTQQGAGWGEGMIILGSEFNKELAAGSDIFDSEGNLDAEGKNALFAQSAGKKDAQANAMRKALGQIDADGNNLVQAAILTDFYEIGVNHAIQEMEKLHASEPETIALFKSMRLGTVALDRSITEVKDVEGNTLDFINVMFATLAMKEKALQEAGTLPKTSDLVHELQSLLLGDTIGNPEENKTLYGLPTIRALTVPTTKEGASLNWQFFRNNATSTFRTGLQNIIRKVPLDNLDLAQTLADKETQLQQQGVSGIPTTKPFALGSKQQEMQTLSNEVDELKEQEGGRSLTNIIRQLKSRQE